MRDHSTSLANMHSPYVYALGWSQFTELFKASRHASESRILGIESVGDDSEFSVQANIEDLLLRKAMTNRLGIELDDDELGDIARDVNARSVDVCMASQSWKEPSDKSDAINEPDYTLELTLLEQVGDLARDVARAKEAEKSPTRENTPTTP
ncbi:hypothetical protein SH449x_003010 [Pirellulaceae bacterium SH449]